MLLLEDVRKSYPQPTGGSVPILDIPKLEIRAGEQMVLRGDSGSGKTTLLQIISGITRADTFHARRSFLSEHFRVP